MSDLTLRQIYYNPEHPAAYGGVSALARASGLSEAVVKDWLKGQSSYTLHKPARKRYSTRHYITSGINHQGQADLVDMQAYARDNDGFKHILTVIDMFSRRGWAEAVKSKTTPDMMGAFTKIFDTGDKPIKLQTDQGLEFESRAMQRFFHDNDIEQFSVKSQFKAAMVERFNRTLKTKMWRFFTHNNTRRWLQVLPKLIEGYNKSYHRSIDTCQTKSTKTRKWNCGCSRNRRKAGTRPRWKSATPCVSARPKMSLKRVIYPAGLRKCLPCQR